jgi:CheY-like chemotaxis protein
MDPFFTTKAHGRGLGMAAVQGIIRSHGGGLQIVSTPRLGTTVRAYLPVNESDLTHHDVRPGKKYRGTVLVAEDEPVVRRFMADVLTREGLQVITADNGETAYTAFKERATEINLVVLDIVMPRQSGAEAYIQMARLRPNLPALFVSGASDEDLTRKGLQVTPQNFLAKPFTREALVAKLKAFF